MFFFNHNFQCWTLLELITSIFPETHLRAWMRHPWELQVSVFQRTTVPPGPSPFAFPMGSKDDGLNQTITLTGRVRGRRFACRGDGLDPGTTVSTRPSPQHSPDTGQRTTVPPRPSPFQMLKLDVSKDDPVIPKVLLSHCLNWSHASSFIFFWRCR